MRRRLSVAVLALACSGPPTAILDGGVADTSLPTSDAAPGDAARPDATPPDDSDLAFRPDRLLEVELTIDPADWDELRQELRSVFETLAGNGTSCTDHPFVSPFQKYAATLRVDGVDYGPVSVKKKGFLGSSWSETKPALKIKMNEYVPDQRLHGLKSLVLNNSLEDPSYVRQCVAMGWFASIGLPVGRCHFAHVRVNGVDLGVYVHVEDIDKQFLGRHYASAGGNLYKGIFSDLDPTWIGTFQKETNEADPDRSDLLAVADALARPDDELEAALAPLLDLDEVTTEWAAGTITRFWDGYAGNQNNFFLYADPTTGRFQVIPWGVDQVFLLNGDSSAILQTGKLALRLYGNPATRQRYLDRVAALLATWDETVLKAEAERELALIEPFLLPDERASVRAAVTDVETFIDGRRADVERSLASPEPPGLLHDPPCIPITGHISGTFSTTYGTLGGATAGGATLTGGPDGAAYAVTSIAAQAGEDPANAANAAIELRAVRPDGTTLIIVLSIEKTHVGDGRSMILTFFGDWPPSYGWIGECDGAFDNCAWLPLGRGPGVTFTTARPESGAPVMGSFDVDIHGWPTW